MNQREKYREIFSPEVMESIFPSGTTDHFFDALYGDSSEGAYDINLEFNDYQDQKLSFIFTLTQRPGECLACNLTYGLPQVFQRHPVINIDGIMEKIEKKLDGVARCERWELGRTREMSRELHVIALTFYLQD